MSLNATLDDEIVYSHLKSERSSAAVRGAAWSTLNSLLPTILNSAVFIVTSRYLLPRDFGIVALSLSIVTFTVALGPGAFGEALIQQPTIRRSNLDTIFWICAISAVLLYGLLNGMAATIAGMLHQEAILPFLPVLGVKLFFDLLAVVPNALIARGMSFHLLALRTGIATILSSAICLTLLFSGYGIWALAISQLSLSITNCIAAFWGAGWRPGFRVNFPAIGALSRYALFASGNRFLQLMNLDQILIGSLVGTSPLGIYNFARRIFQMINDVLAGGLTSVSHALLSSLQDDRTKTREAFLMATFGCSLIAFPAFMGLAAVAGDAVPLIFGDHWTGAIWPLRWFCIIGLMSGVGVIQGSLISSQGKTNWWFYYQLLRNILTLGTVILLRDRGITVIVAAIAIQVLLLWPITLVMVSRLIDLTIRGYFAQFIPPLCGYVVLLLAVEGTAILAGQWHPAIRLSAEIAIGGLAYLAVIALLCRPRLKVIVDAVLKARRGKRKAGLAT